MHSETHKLTQSNPLLCLTPSVSESHPDRSKLSYGSFLWWRRGSEAMPAFRQSCEALPVLRRNSEASVLPQNSEAAQLLRRNSDASIQRRSGEQLPVSRRGSEVLGLSGSVKAVSVVWRTSKAKVELRRVEEGDTEEDVAWVGLKRMGRSIEKVCVCARVISLNRIVRVNHHICP